jgi:aryl-alcohol dehydrogenase-like predicted oxidoreductase
MTSAPVTAAAAGTWKLGTWTLQRGPHQLVIPGTSNLDHLADNVAAGALRLTEDEMTRLESLPGHA